MERFAEIGIRAGELFKADELSPELKDAIEAGMADAWGAFGEVMAKLGKGE